MTDKQQINAIQQILIGCCNYVDENGNILGNKCSNCEHWDDTNNVCCSYERKQAEALYNAGCRKVAEQTDLELENKIYKKALELSVSHQVVFVKPLLVDYYLRQARAEIEQEVQDNV